MESEKKTRTSFDKYITGLESHKLFGTRRKTNFDYFTADENEAEEKKRQKKKKHMRRVHKGMM